MSESIGKHILLVEDEALIAMNGQTQLEEYGYSIHHVATGEKAVQTITDNRHPVDLILMDINLGSGIDGTQAAEIILKNHDIPIVFLSAHTEPEIVEKTEKITSYGYVVKNSSATVLDASIKMALKLFEAKKAHSLKEAALQESEKRFYELFERAPLGYQSLDGDGRFLEVNQAWCETLGYNHEDVIGKWFGDFLAPEYVQAFSERFPLFKAQGRIHSEFYMLHKNGNRMYMAFDGRVGLNEDGTFKQTHCILKDETERRQAEEALLASKEQLETVSNNIPGGVVYQLIVDPRGNRRLAYVSSVVERLHGVTQEEALNDARAIYDQVHEDDIQKLIEAEDQAFNTLQPFSCEVRIRRADGEIRWLQLQSAISKRPDGSIVADGIEIDITERKRMEVALNESMKRYHDLVALIPVGVYIVWIRANGHMEFEYVSDRWCEIHGLCREDVMRDVAVADNMVLPDDRESFLKCNRKAARDRKPFRWEGRFLTGDGDLRWLHIESNPVVFDNNDICWFGVTQDITEQKKAEEEIQKQLTEKETLLREVHHRVKNNIANIEGLLSLQAGATVHAEVKAALKDAVSRVQSIRVLYDKLLLSKDLDEVSIKNYAESLLDSLVMVFDPEDFITIEKHIADFTVDARKVISIGIIINELLTNVFKYAFKERDKGTVSVSIEKTGRMVTLIIQDNGIGIDERVLENKSSGFGLAIVKMLVEQLEGTYGIENRNGTWSAIQFEI